jgi:hypothetical protein
VVQAPNDKQRFEPMLGKIEALPEQLRAAETLLAGHRLFQRGECQGCRQAEIEPLIAMGRQPHHPPLDERFGREGPAPENPTPVEAMAHRLKTPEGRKLYALRKQTPEPVFGVIKSALGFRQFSLRGLDKVRGEWSLVTMAWNLKRMFVLAPLTRRPSVPAPESKRPKRPKSRLSTARGSRPTPQLVSARQNPCANPRQKHQSDRLLGECRPCGTSPALRTKVSPRTKEARRYFKWVN